jgi:hypothetical protein
LADESTNGICGNEEQADHGKEWPDCVAANYLEVAWASRRNAMHSEWRLVPTHPPGSKYANPLRGCHSVDQASAFTTTRIGEAWQRLRTELKRDGLSADPERDWYEEPMAYQLDDEDAQGNAEEKRACLEQRHA